MNISHSNTEITHHEPTCVSIKAAELVDRNCAKGLKY